MPKVLKFGRVFIMAKDKMVSYIVHVLAISEFLMGARTVGVLHKRFEWIGWSWRILFHLAMYDIKEWFVS